MSGYLPLTFIEEKVRDLENALFFSMSDSVLKIPACVVKVLEADELGQLWFVIPKPSQFIHAFDKTFPVELDFFRKGKDYYLKVFGRAHLVNDPEEINSVECLHDETKEQARKNETVLVKVKMTSAEYTERSIAKSPARSLVQQVKNSLYRWFQLSQPQNNLNYQKIPVKINYPSITSFTN
jgi:general stress protein 26